MLRLGALLVCGAVAACAPAPQPATPPDEGAPRRLAEEPRERELRSGGEHPKKQDWKPPTPVPVATLRGVLPDSVAGMARSDHASVNLNAAVVALTAAEAGFTSPDGARGAGFYVSDAGSEDVGAGLELFLAFANAFEREGRDGYERPTTIHGYPAHESFSHDGYGRTRSDVTLIAAGRFMVVAGGWGLADGELTKLVQGIDFAALERLRGYGGGPSNAADEQPARRVPPSQEERATRAEESSR
jgi:hypothetical protein